MSHMAGPLDQRSSASAVPLVFRAAPVPGQSIAEVILEAAADNSYRTAGHVISAAGIDYRGDPSIFARARGREEDLAITLRMPGQVDLLRSISPNPIAGRPGWSDFFGVPLRNVHRDMRRRRVSPRSLMRSLHLKAIWSVRVLSFDPLTKESLLEQCPECGRQPTYLRTYGVQFCEFCVQSDEDGFPAGKVDFRDFPQPVVEVDDVEGLDFAVGLLDPEGRDARNLHGRLHAELGEFGAGDLFELTVATACALTTRPSWKATTLDRPSRQDEYARFTPDVLAKAARMLLDWPDGFHRIAAEVRECAKDRAGHYGVRKELGPLVALGMDANLQPGIQRLIKHRIRLDMGLTSGVANTVRRAEHRSSSTFIPIQQAAQEYGMTRRAISRLVKRRSVRAMKVSDAVKAPVLVDSQQLAEMIGSRIFGVPSQSVAVDLGIPRACLRSLADAGFLVRLDPEPLAHRGGDYYLKDSVDELRRRCEMMAADGARPEGWVRITKAVNRLRLAEANPWPEIVAGILGGEIKIWRVEGRLTALMTSHAVKDLRELRHIASHEGQRVDDDIVYTQAEAADFLRTTSVRVNGLIRLGLLPPRPTLVDLREFGAQYVLTAEVAEQFAIEGRKLRWRDVPSLLRTSGVEPAVAIDGTVGLVWRRAEVEPVIAQDTQSIN